MAKTKKAEFEPEGVKIPKSIDITNGILKLKNDKGWNILLHVTCIAAVLNNNHVSVIYDIRGTSLLLEN